MSAITSTFRRDANNVPIDGLGLTDLKSISFDGGTGTGAVGATTLFTVTGKVAVNVFGFCTGDLASTSGTVEIGTASSTACLCDQQTATNIDNHEVWHDSNLAVGAVVGGHVHPIDEDIVLTIASAGVTGGSMDFYALWFPLSSGSSLTVA